MKFAQCVDFIGQFIDIIALCTLYIGSSHTLIGYFFIHHKYLVKIKTHFEADSP